APARWARPAAGPRRCCCAWSTNATIRRLTSCSCVTSASTPAASSSTTVTEPACTAVAVVTAPPSPQVTWGTLGNQAPGGHPRQQDTAFSRQRGHPVQPRDPGPRPPLTGRSGGADLARQQGNPRGRLFVLGGRRRRADGKRPGRRGA